MASSVTSGASALAIISVSACSCRWTADASNTFFLSLYYICYSCTYAYHNYKTCNKICHSNTSVSFDLYTYRLTTYAG